MRGLFITGVGTGVGKTFLTRGLARALSQRGAHVAAVKPIETGVVDLERSDAHALARACGRVGLRDAPGFYRVERPLAPRSVALEGGPVCPQIPGLVAAIHAACRPADLVLIEGAGGLLVPLDERATSLDLMAALGLPILLVASDQLGVLSHVLAAHACAAWAGVPVLGVVLMRASGADPDPSVGTNRTVLAERLPVPVLAFSHAPDDDDGLAQAALGSGVVELVDSTLPSV